MPEPTSTTAGAYATLATAGVSIPMVSLFGIQTGLRPELLIAGFAGALAAIVLLNSVPSEGESFGAIIRTAIKRMMVILASSLVAGYMAPLTTLAINMPALLLGGVAFGVGAGAQRSLVLLMSKVNADPAKEGN